MTYAEFSDLADTIQSLAIAVAVLVGGGWALFRFFSLRAIDQARTDLESARRTLRERSIVEVTLDADQITSDFGHLIAVVITLKNVGSGTEVTDWSSSVINATKVSGIAGTTLQFSEVPILGQRKTATRSSTLVPGESWRNSFIIPVLESGIYYLFFSVDCSPEESTIARRERALAGIEAGGPYHWSTDLFFHVRETTA